MLKCKEISSDIWNYRLGHPRNKVIEHICNKFSYVQSSFGSICDICHFSEQHKLPFQHIDISSLNAFDLIHTDIWGLVNISIVHGHKYFLTIVEDYTRNTWIYLMKVKSKIGSLLHIFVSCGKNQLGKNIKLSYLIMTNSFF